MFSKLAVSYNYIQQYGCNYDHADYNSLDTNLCTDHVQTIFQCLPNGCTCEGSKKDSCSSKWGNATDYAGCYAVHLVHVSSFHISHTSLCAKDKANHTGAYGAYQISLYCGGNYVYTRKLCCVHVRTDCVNMTACTCLG